jgi:hypothetical protein
MDLRAVWVLGLLGLATFAEAEAGPRKNVLTAQLTACALAAADPTTGKAFGTPAEGMQLTCMVTGTSRTWDCLTAYPNEPDKSQHWTMTAKRACKLFGEKVVACGLRSDTGSLFVQLGGGDGGGIAQLRLDLDAGTAMAARVCAGMFVTGSSP